MTTALLIVLGAALTGLYVMVRPGWNKSGPYLVDALVIAISLYAAGACAVDWTTLTAHSEIVLTMSLVTLDSALAGAILFSVLSAHAYAGLNFKHLCGVGQASGRETPIIMAIAIFSGLASAIFVYMLFTSPILGQFLTIENIIKYSTLSYARNAVASGSAGYMAPGFIKQFRDTLLPLALFAMAILYRRPFREWSFWVVFAITLLAMLVNGQRSNMLVLLLGVGISLYYGSAGRNRSRRGMSFKQMVAMVLAALIGWTLLTAALGRTGAFGRSAFTIPYDAVAGLFDRVATTLPRENASTYPIWGALGPTDGKFWMVSFGSIFKTNAPTDNGLMRLSNLLSEYRGSSALGDSPLGMPPDIWLTWGWLGLFLVPMFYAFFVGMMDIFLLSETSPLFVSIKVYMFIIMPLCVSPYTFILNGGAVALMLIAGIKGLEWARLYLPKRRVPIIQL